MNDDWPAVGDAVHCPHAEADGIVSGVIGGIMIVRVTWTYGRGYTIGAEYGWLPMQIRPLAEPTLNSSRFLSRGT